MPLIGVSAARIIAASLTAIQTKKVTNRIFKFLELVGINFFGCHVGHFEQRRQNSVFAPGQRPFESSKKMCD
jgi:hypothetical protein